MTVKMLPTLPANARGIQIIEQADGRFSIYSETGPWSKLEEEILLGKDLNEQEAFDMAESFEPTTEKKKREAAPQRRIERKEKVTVPEEDSGASEER